MICHDFSGKVIWQRDLGKVDHEFGNGTSPMLVGDHVILYQGPGDESYLVALEKATGKTAWKIQRPTPTQGASRKDNFRGNANGAISSYTTPLVVSTEGREELVMGFPEIIMGINPSNGAEIWRCSGIVSGGGFRDVFRRLRIGSKISWFSSLRNRIPLDVSS
jgi:outer membrane protein assembly factor BamB